MTNQHRVISDLVQRRVFDGMRNLRARVYFFEPPKDARQLESACLLEGTRQLEEIRYLRRCEKPLRNRDYFEKTTSVLSVDYLYRRLDCVS